MEERFEQHGFVAVAAALDTEGLSLAKALLADHLASGAGTRTLLEDARCAALAAALARDARLGPLLRAAPRAVQCTAFAKTPETNWLVAPHQDLSIPVAARSAHPALRGSTEKEGRLFAQPPAPVLETLVAIRVHLDDCGPDDGPLRVVPGSHRHGILDAAQATDLRVRTGEHTCLLSRGDALVLRPLLLHASSKSTSGRPRRVLHFLFGPDELPFGLRWPGA